MTHASETLSPALPTDIEQMALKLLQRAVDRNRTLATAESCTGGLLASLLTDVEGCAHCFERGFVTYTEQAMIDQLGLPSDLLASKGAVSSEVAEAMASGALAKSAADMAVAVTGFAGPGGPDEEAGLVYISVARRDGGTRTREHHFGDVGRGEVRIRCLRSALEMLLAGLADSRA